MYFGGLVIVFELGRVKGAMDFMSMDSKIFKYIRRRQ